MLKLSVLLCTLLFISPAFPEYYLPINSPNRQSLAGLRLTDIGPFGLMRKARPGVPAHYHTGIDIRRPSKNYTDEPVFPLMEGVVISKREDGPYAQLILEHEVKGKKLWTVYEHIAGIMVGLGDPVKPKFPMARFMNKTELNKYGWQFDHFHFEILKVPPLKQPPTKTNPQRCFSSFTLVCFKKEDLEKYFHDPRGFLRERL